MEDIAALRKALEEYRKESEAISSAQKQLAHYELVIDQAAQRRTTADRQIRALMEKMDCASPGNAGYENRLLVLLEGIAQHSEEYGRTHQ